MPMSAANLPPGLAPASVTPHLSREDGPGPAPFFCISREGIRLAAHQLGRSQHEAILLFLEQDIWPLRFKQNRGVFTCRDQAALLRARVAVLGCGGLGGHLAVLLARLGVGRFTLCDHDGFDESNLNRQLLCREDRLGMNKALIAREEVAGIASHAEVRAVTQAATEETLPDILRDAAVAADCLDDPATRLLAEQAAKRAGIPFVHGAIAGMEGFALLSADDAAAVLGRLYPAAGATKSTRAEYRQGVPALTPAVTAALQALLIVRHLTGVVPSADGVELLHLDLSVPEIERLQL